MEGQGGRGARRRGSRRSGMSVFALTLHLHLDLLSVFNFIDTCPVVDIHKQQQMYSGRENIPHGYDKNPAGRLAMTCKASTGVNRLPLASHHCMCLGAEYFNLSCFRCPPKTLISRKEGCLDPASYLQLRILQNQLLRMDPQIGEPLVSIRANHCYCWIFNCK